MDGTLTRPVHDFQAIRERIGIPPGKPILEHINSLSGEAGARSRAELAQIEGEVATLAAPEPGADEFVAALARDGRNLGIVTRNSRSVAHQTLEAAGLAHHFPENCVISRECAAAKPSPEGILVLLKLWDCDPDDCVMMGDYVFDLEAGRRAGVFAIHLDRSASFPWPEYTDLGVSDYAALQDHLSG